MEDDLSLYMIPDTPSPVFRSKTCNHRPATHINTRVSSDELLSHKSIPDVNSHVNKLYSWNIGAFHNESLRGKTDASCSLASDDRNASTDNVNGLSLPGSPKFARERAEAVMKMKDKHNLSPFAKLKKDVSFCRKRTEKTTSSGFNNDSNTAIKLKAKKRRVETIALQDADRTVRPKVRKIKSTYAWPSSSDSNDDEFSKCKKTLSTNEHNKKRNTDGYLKDVCVKKQSKTGRTIPLSAIGGIDPDPVEHTEEELCDEFSKCKKTLSTNKHNRKRNTDGYLKDVCVKKQSKTGRTGPLSAIGGIDPDPVEHTEEELCDTGSFKSKLKLVIKTGAKTSATGKLRHGPINYLSSDDEMLNISSQKKTSKSGVRSSDIGKLRHGPINYLGSDDEMLNISSHKKTSKSGVRSSDIGSLYPKPVDDEMMADILPNYSVAEGMSIHPVDDEMMADILPNYSVAESLSMQSVATSTHSTATEQALSFDRHGVNPKLFYKSNDIPLGTNSPGLGRMDSTYGTSQPPITSPVLSSCSHQMTGFVSPKRSLFGSKTKRSRDCSKKTKPSKLDEATATFPASLNEMKTVQRTRGSPSQNKWDDNTDHVADHVADGNTDNVADCSLGSNDNPIDVETLTADTQQALMEIRQVQTDEDMARQMQEELDREFAMSLQHNANSETHCPHHHTGAHPTGATNLVDLPDDNPHWHWNSPVRSRAHRRRNYVGGHTRRERLDHPPDNHEAMLQLLRQSVQTINTELGANADNDVPFDQWFGHSPHRGRRRRGRRAGSFMDGLIFSPAVPGDDYENLMNLADILGDVKEKGLSLSDLGRLPVVSYKKTDIKEVEECNICMTDYQEGDSQKILPCFHSFHGTCIDKWIQKNATCPICRVEVKVN